jgi:hypothetical protein
MIFTVAMIAQEKFGLVVFSKAFPTATKAAQLNRRIVMTEVAQHTSAPGNLAIAALAFVGIGTGAALDAGSASGFNSLLLAVVTGTMNFV